MNRSVCLVNGKNSGITIWIGLDWIHCAQRPDGHEIHEKTHQIIPSKHRIID